MPTSARKQEVERLFQEYCDLISGRYEEKQGQALNAAVRHLIDTGTYLNPTEEHRLPLEWTPEYEIGRLIVLLYLARVPVEVFRLEMEIAWGNAWADILEAITPYRKSLDANGRRRLRAMFKRAQFPIPEELPDTIQVWRGGYWKSVPDLQSGFAWTTNRDTACCFAVRHQMEIPDWPKEAYPLVITAHVPKSSLLMYSVRMNESEVICLDVKNAVVDGTAANWAECCRRFLAEQERADQEEIEAYHRNLEESK
jgi:hypothetical protein